MENDRATWITNRTAIDAILVTTDNVSKLPNTKHEIMLLLLKLKKYGEIITQKVNVLLNSNKWKDRTPPVFKMYSMTQEQVVVNKVNTEEFNNEDAEKSAKLVFQTEVV